MKRAREDAALEDGEITSTQILDELSILKEEVQLLKEEKALLSSQLSEAIGYRDKYKDGLEKRKDRTKKWKEDLEDETLESVRADYVELKYEFEKKKEKRKQEKNKWRDRVDRLEVKIEALKEENEKLVVTEARLRSDYERKLMSSSTESRYKDQIKQLEDSLRNSEVAFRAADALHKEQEEIAEKANNNAKQLEEQLRAKEEKVMALQMAASRASQQLADASNALDHAAQQKTTMERSLQTANAKFHEQMKVDAQKLTNIMTEVNEKNRIISELKNAAMHTSAKIQMLENSEQTVREELARLTAHPAVDRQEQFRKILAENNILTQQLTFRNGGHPDPVLRQIESFKAQNISLTTELQRVKALALEHETEKLRLMDEIQTLRGKNRFGSPPTPSGSCGPNGGPNGAMSGLQNGHTTASNGPNSPMTRIGPNSPMAGIGPTGHIGSKGGPIGGLIGTPMGGPTGLLGAPGMGMGGLMVPGPRGPMGGPGIGPVGPLGKPGMVGPMGRNEPLRPDTRLNPLLERHYQPHNTGQGQEDMVIEQQSPTPPISHRPRLNGTNNFTNYNKEDMVIEQPPPILPPMLPPPMLPPHGTRPPSYNNFNGYNYTHTFNKHYIKNKSPGAG